MIDHLGLGRMAVLLVAALVVFGPERLPDIASQLGRALRQVRGVLNNMSAEVKSSVGPELAELDLRSMHPKTFLTGLMDDPASVAAAPRTVVGSHAMTLLHSADEIGAPIPAAWLGEIEGTI